MNPKIGEYEILGELGRGGMATVYRAHDPSFDREVAIKLLPREFLHDPTFRDRFRHEAKIIASLEHPAIVPVYYFGEEDGQPFIVMRYMAGGSLAERIARGPLPMDEIIRILAALAPALDEAHARGIIHRDLKPGNILFDQRGAPYISDFGIAKLTESSLGLSVSGGIVGTPAYMSPEQARGESGLDRQSDIYALGAILFEMLTGRLPYQADTPMGMALRHVSDPVPQLREAKGDIPAQFQKIIDKAMAKQRQERYASAHDFVQALRDVGGLAPAPSPETTPPTVVVTPPPAPVDTPTERLNQERSAELPFPPPRPVEESPPRSFPLGWLMFVILLLAALAFLVQGGLGNPGELGTGGTALGSDTPAATQSATSTTSPASPEPVTQLSTASPALDIGSTLRSEVDGMTLVFVPAGEFLMGSVEQSAELHEKPQHTVFLDAFWIDQTEVTNAMYEGCVSDGACQPPDPTTSPTGQDYFGTLDFADYPVINVSWEDAAAYCTWAGRRLPTETEWEKAARGTEGQRFAWGDEAVTGERLNFCDKNCPFDYKDSNIDDGFADTAPVGSYEAGRSPYGALDMSGNVWEWVADWYEPDYYSRSPEANPPGPERGEGKVLRGGAWDDVVRPLTARGVLGTDEHKPFLGFRCAQTP